MHFRAVLFGSLLTAAVLGAPVRAASQTPAANAAPDAKTAEARRHFKSGVALYQSGNHGGALAEFEAAYAEKPGPGSLQNVALCQKALLRYAEAADTLKLLLERHASELSEDERTAARIARDELEANVGSLVVSVRPAHAKVTLDGRALDGASLGVPIRTNAGDHALVADAPGHARTTHAVRVVAGTRALAVELVLEPVMAFLDVTTSDPAALVAIDGRPLGMGAWSGPVSPDQEHLVQVYRPGFEPFETRVAVAVGQTKPIFGALGPRVGGVAGAPPDARGLLPPPPDAKPQLGWYGIAGLNLFGMGPAPLHFDTSATSASGGALSLNLRVGRDLKRTLRVEMLLDVGRLNVEDACDEATVEGSVADECGGAGQVSRDYQLGWFRLGPLVRLSTPGEHFRVSGGLGAGFVWHELRVAADDTDENREGGKAAGVDPFFLLEVGVAYHFGHLSVGIDLAAQIDGASSLDGDFDGSHQKAFDRSGNALPMLGIGLRAGYSQWATEKQTP